MYVDDKLLIYINLYKMKLWFSGMIGNHLSEILTRDILLLDFHLSHLLNLSLNHPNGQNLTSVEKINGKHELMTL